MNILNMITSRLNLNQETIQKIQEAWKIAQKYPANKEGMLQAVKDFGGKTVLKKGLETLNKPNVTNTLSMFGVDIDRLKNTGQILLNENENNKSDNDLSDIKNRLSKL